MSAPRYCLKIVALLVCLSCSRTHGAGVTLVTHGFNGNIGDWVIPMLGRAPSYPGFPGTNSSCYSITIRRTAGNIVASRALLSGSTPVSTDSGEILVKLDWSSLAGIFGSASSTEVATGAVGALVSTNLFPELGGRALAELPLHLIGHSRGGSVVSEMARLLGAQGIWVDHVTLLDPHPVVEFGDAEARTWQNILFAESYWQMNSDFTCPNGEAVAGAYNRFLTSLGGGYSCPHSDVHLWYYGTIDQRTPTGYDGVSITGGERQTWWTMAEAAGAQAGFRYSRIGGGNRLSMAEPAGQGTGRIGDGMNQRWDFGAGASNNRVGLVSNSGLWPSLIQFNITGTNRVAPGAATMTRVVYQAGTNTNGLVGMRFFLDRDANPFNSNSVEMVNATVATSGPNEVYAASVAMALPANMTPGDYRLVAQLTAGSRTRYLYAPEALSVLENVQPPRIALVEPAIGMTHLTIEAQVGRRVVLQASSNLTSWVAIATNVVDSNPFVVTEQGAAQPQRFYRAIIVD